MRQKLSQHKRSGFVLVLVLGVVMLLSTLLFGFSHTTRTQLGATDSFYRTEQAWNCARAGLQIAVAAIGDTNDVCTDSRFANLMTGENTFSVGNGSCSITIVAESGLLNVNGLRNKTGRLERTRIDQFLRLIDLLNRHKTNDERIGYGIVPAIIDWTDFDEEVTQLPFVQHDSLGVEEEYYRTCDPPYHCRNKPVDAIDELLWVKGMTPKALSRLRDVLTCFGPGKININAAPRLVVECLSEQMDPALVQMILSRRRLEPFAHVADLRNVPGMTDNIYQSIKDSITTRSEDQYYRVTSQGNVADRSCKIEAILCRNAEAANVDIILYREL